MRVLTHINGLTLPDLFTPVGERKAHVKLESFEESAPPKQTIQDLPGGSGGVQGTPLRDVRRITLRFIIGGDARSFDEPLRVLRRLFALGTSSTDTVTLGLTENNFPGAGPHWSLETMVSDLLFQETGRQALRRCQVQLTAADPDYVGSTLTRTLREGRIAVGKTYDHAEPYTYSGLRYYDSLTVFLPGSAVSKMSAKIYGPAVNPKLLNATTGQFVLVNQTLLGGDTLEIDEDSVVRLNGQYKNSLKEVGTLLPTLPPGKNRLILLDDTSPLEEEGPTADITYTARDA